MLPIPAILRVAALPPEDLIIGDYAFKVNTSTDYIYLYLFTAEHGIRPHRIAAAGELKALRVQEIDLGRGNVKFFPFMDHVIRRGYFITDKANRITFITANPLAKPCHFCRWPIQWMNNNTRHAATRCGFVQRDAYRDCIPVKELNRRRCCLRSG
ncbi:hypothetical protein ACMSJL_005305 [Klebsiella pneumoniae]